MLATKIEDMKNEEGFTLIELLVVVIIIGILAAIAIPVFLNQREGAQRNALQASIQSVVTQTEVAFTSGAANYGAATTTATSGMTLPPTVTIVPKLYGTDGVNGYCIEGTDTRLTTTGTYSQEMRGASVASIKNVACPA